MTLSIWIAATCGLVVGIVAASFHERHKVRVTLFELHPHGVLYINRYNSERVLVVADNVERRPNRAAHTVFYTEAGKMCTQEGVSFYENHVREDTLEQP